ncbi:MULTISPECIES: hypothetical protein [Clostridium]|uniref:Uncharacterized protein n=1 Tax=Clostridium frigoriphilum TaxID=443253 RepID=A0ABU7UKN3_9CLOT|nr:hypothetical protein [Clostridium sp. DSM 17811]MBU3097679.1 hypothetical protein [Clostridium sp. DSM 17811]
MIKIAHKTETELETLSGLPAEVVAKVVEIATILNDCYGHTRDEYLDLGGYILIAEDEKDVETIRKKIDLGCTLPEFVDKIICSNGEIYTNSLMILSSDYSISVIIPKGLTPKELLKYMDE